MKHDFINTGDPDVFPAIQDRNGEVVLSYCRRCRKAEGELEERCNPIGRNCDERIAQIKMDFPKRFPVRFSVLLCNAIDWVYEYIGPEKALEEAEYLHAIGAANFRNRSE